MYVTVSWHLLPDQDTDPLVIQHMVEQAFGTLPRCRMLSTTAVLRPKTWPEFSTLIAQLDNIEQAFGPQFGYTLFMHTDGDRFRCSDVYDVASARALTKAVPL